MSAHNEEEEEDELEEEANVHIPEPTKEELGTTRPAPFHPMNVVVDEVTHQGKNFFIRVCVDKSLLELITASERETVPHIEYKKLEMPRNKVTKGEPLTMEAVLAYADFNASDAYVDSVRKELLRSDYKGTSGMYTDVLVGAETYKKADGIAMMTRPDPQVPNNAVVTVAAVALTLPAQRKVHVYLRVLPQIARRLVHHLLTYHRLPEMDQDKQLRDFSVIRVVHERRGREVLFCAALCSPEHPAAEHGMPTIGTPAFDAYGKLMRKTTRR